jgi:hypothetical protein
MLEELPRDRRFVDVTTAVDRERRASTKTAEV